VVTLVLALLTGCERAIPAAPEGPRPDGWATIRGQRVALELAITPAEQRLGLGRRDALPWDHGMLFLYTQPAFHRFWMKDMRFDIDIVWIRGDRIVDISHRVPHVPGGNGPTVAPAELADKVLEVNAGYASAHGWRPGHRVELELARPWPPPAGR
jgi:uncharacterized membrane protein (UPF0127 family)